MTTIGSRIQNAAEEEILGLEIDAVRLCAHHPEWEDLYRAEAERIRAVLGSMVVEIQHYGSTAVPGIKAKPILDILIGVRRFDDGQHCVEPLEAIGYDYAPQAAIPGDYTFGKGTRRTHLAHVVVYGGSNWNDCLAFRDALRSDPRIAVAYERLKTELARTVGHDRPAYTSGKAEFVRQVVSSR